MKSLLSIFLAYSFLLIPLSKAADIVLDTDTSIKYIRSGKQDTILKGQKYHYTTTEPVLLEKDGKLPLLLVPINYNSDIQINQPNLSENQKNNDQEVSKQNLNFAMSELTLQVFQIQKYISLNQLDEAKNSLTKIKGKYPDVIALEFLSVSVLLLESKKKEAITRLEEALKKLPDYSDGQTLLKVLKNDQGGHK